MIQLSLFDTSMPQEEAGDEISQLRQENIELRQIILDVKNSNDKVRKALFARHGELAKMFLDIYERQEIIIRNLCQNTNTPTPRSREEKCVSIGI